MAKMQLQNRTRNPYKIPLSNGAIDNSGARMIPPGMTGEIDADKHSQLMKANRAYSAMVEQGKLKVSALALDEVPTDELESTSDAEKPADLLENLEAEGAEGAIEVAVESTGIELIEAPTDEAPKKKKAPAKKK